MLANTFSHGMIRNYVVGFGTLFNNIKINRRASSGESASTIAVPLSYAPRQRFIERIAEDYNLDKPVAMSLPRMSFEMMGMTYSSERKLNTIQRYVGHYPTANTKMSSVYSPVPYDFNFQLNIYINNIEDGTHIVEQILPYFTPEFTVTLKGATSLDIPTDLPIVLNAVNMDDSYEGGFDDRRIIIWTMDFTLKGNLYGAISESGIINKIFINLRPSMNTSVVFNSNTSEQVIIQPSQFANGVATNSAALSIAPNLIDSNSDFGIAQDIYGVSDDPNVYKIWEFNGPKYGTVAFGQSAGNTTVDGWEFHEVFANGDVAVSGYNNQLRHTITKDESVVDHQEDVTIQTYANNTPEWDQFYGKNFQVVDVEYSTSQTAGSGASLDYLGYMRWTTTNSGEGEFGTGSTEGTTGRFKRAHTSAIPSSFDGNKYSLKFDMAGHTLRDWDDRIITGIRFEIVQITDASGPATIVTNIDNIKISANTTG